MKTKYLFIVLLFVAFHVFAQQDVPFEKKYFADGKTYKEAKKAFDNGNLFFSKGQYLQAIDEYTKAYNLNPNNALLNFKMGVAYLKYNAEKALEHLKKAEQLNPRCDAEFYFYLARAYHLNHQFDEALEKYKSYKSSLNPRDYAEKSPIINKYIQECENGKELIKKPVKVFIDNLGPEVNTIYREICPIVNADESQIIFTSRSDKVTGGKLDPQDNMYYEDIFIAEKVNDNWIVKNPGKPVNSEYHDAIAGVSPDGQTIFIYKGDNGGDIYISKLKGTSWSKPERMSKNINTKYHESSVSLGPDGRTLYFVSDRPGGVGSRDIWVSYMDKKGNWGPPINLRDINTPYDEEAVFIHPDGKTLYFSSKGWNTMGGYDIFKTVYENGHWSKPENVGYPINTADDDVFFTIAASGIHAYMSSARPGGYGDQDLYMITFITEKPTISSSEDNLIAWKTEPVSETVAEKTVAVSLASLTLLKGRILDDATKQPVEATIILTDNEKGEELATFTSNSATGKYLISLPSGKNYGIAVKAEGYLFYSENFNIPANAPYQEIEKDIYLKKIDIGASIVLRNIFFDFNKATLRPESKTELDGLIQLMKDNPTLKIEISGHTDNIGSAEYNKKLSEQRAKAVVDYLIAAGISSDRLTYVGYGFEKPIAPNTTEEGRQLNRRTEFKIISK